MWMGKSGFINYWKQKTRDLEIDTYALYFACRDPRIPWYVKGFVIVIVAYAFSPIDLIPDFIPVLGYLDDLVVIPAGVFLVLKMIPPQIMEECRAMAKEHIADRKPHYKFMALIVICVWIIVISLAGNLLIHTLKTVNLRTK
jgi:uncharacterized membrane protein YkvA (DUF1232 family)